MASLSQWFFGHLYVYTNKFRDEISALNGSQQCAIKNQSKETRTFDSTGLTLNSNGKKNLDDGHNEKLMGRNDHHQIIIKDGQLETIRISKKQSYCRTTRAGGESLRFFQSKVCPRVKLS